MKPANDDKRVDALLADEFSREEPQFDFTAWKARHRSEVEEFVSEARNHSASARARPGPWPVILESRAVRAVAAAALILAAVLCLCALAHLPFLFSPSPSCDS